MTTQEARRAIYAAAHAIDAYVPEQYSDLREDAFDMLEDALVEIRISEATLRASGVWLA